MDDFLEKKPKKHSDAASATAARFSWEKLRFFPYLGHARADCSCIVKPEMVPTAAPNTNR